MAYVKVSAVPYDPSIPVLTPVGTCCKSIGTKGFTHYYQQREHDVLHLNSDAQIINTLYDNYLTEEGEKKHYELISAEEFTDVLRRTIYNLNIGYAWNATA
jgi:hypothetical protein